MFDKYLAIRHIEKPEILLIGELLLLKNVVGPPGFEPGTDRL